MDESGLLSFVRVLEYADQGLGLGALLLESRNISVQRFERIKRKAFVKACLQERKPRSRRIRRGRRNAYGLLQLLLWKKIAVERLVKLRGQIALGESFEQKLSVQRQLAAMCRHVTIEKISCFDQDCAKRKQRLALGLLVVCPPYTLRRRTGCRNKFVSLIQIDGLVTGCPSDGHYEKKSNQQWESTAFAHNRHRIGRNQPVLRPVPRPARRSASHLVNLRLRRTRARQDA